MKYRIKALHYKNESVYFPQWKLFCFWFYFEDELGRIESSSRIKIEKFLNNYIDKKNPKIEYIPYET